MEIPEVHAEEAAEPHRVVKLDQETIKILSAISKIAPLKKVSWVRANGIERRLVLLYLLGIRHHGADLNQTPPSSVALFKNRGFALLLVWHVT